MPDIIAISPSGNMINEAQLINALFEAGLHRYHIAKDQASEQQIAEILQDLLPQYLGQISLHSHFHLVLAYGVGGIHYSETHRLTLGKDFPEKLKLYQGFGIKVSTAVKRHFNDAQLTDYVIEESTLTESNAPSFIQVNLNDLDHQAKHIAIRLSEEADFKRLLDFLGSF